MGFCLHPSGVFVRWKFFLLVLRNVLHLTFYNITNMKKYSYLLVPILIITYCCNSEKQVLKSPDKTKRVVNAWLQTNNFKSDTQVVYKPGDTTTELLVSYDTTQVHDTLTNVTEKTVTKKSYIYRTVHDTVKLTITNNKLLEECQSNLVISANKVKIAEIDKQMAILKEAKARLLLYSLLGLLGLSAVVGVVLKAKSII